MSGYDYNGFVKSFSKRTRDNMGTIDKIKKGTIIPCKEEQNRTLVPTRAEVYEVTQLINSLFGLLIIPQEIFKDDMTELNENAKDGNKNSNNEFGYRSNNDYKKLESIVNNLEQDNRLQTTYGNYYDPVISFMRHLRNALSHSGTGLHFTPVSKNSQIEQIYFYDQNIRDKGKTSEKYMGEFCTLLTIDEIRLIIKHINGFYLAWEQDHNYKDENRYNKEIEIYADFLKDKSKRCYEKLDNLNKK